MALETVALAVGKAVGDRAIRTWLNARSTTESRDRSLVELMRSRLPDQLIRRKAERQIEDIADSITARVLKLCAHEYKGLTDEDRTAVLAEVTLTLSNSDLSDEALLATDADPTKLAQALRRTTSAPRGFGEAASRLYEVILDECCDCLLRIVRQLPEFQPRAASEILSRLTALAEEVERVLSQLPTRSLDAPQGTAHDEEFARRYLEHVSKTLDHLDLIGVRIDRYKPRTSLSMAYISLSVTTAVRASRDCAVGPWAAQSAESATMRVESALGHSNRMLLRGEAGGGKSTLLRWLGITAARGGFEAELAIWNGCVPFLIKLRSYVDRSLPKPEQFLDGVADPIAGLMPQGWVHRRLSSGHALLLVDGVDELSGSQRRAVKPWLRGLLTAFPKVRIVVTSRPTAATASWLDDEGFAPAFLERMSPTDTQALIQHWHIAIKDSPDLPCPASSLPSFETRLLARLQGAAHLRALAATPLLASMLCALNLDRGTQLPPDRMGVYGAALDMLLVRRDAEREIPSYGEVHLDRAQKMQILQELAWQLSVTNRVELPKSAALTRVSKIVNTMPRMKASGEAVLQHLLERSGVLREPAEGRIDFVHRTIQEYLTALAAAQDGDMEPLILNAHRDQWREVVIMAAGHANAPLREELLEGLLGRIADEAGRARRLKLLVAACLETLPSVPPRLRSQVDACLDELIPPRDLTAARSLATAGEIVLDRLPLDITDLPSGVAQSTVRTAWLINGPKALSALERYAKDERGPVRRELNKAWRYFDPDLYAQRILQQRKDEESGIFVETAAQLQAVKHVPYQSSLSLRNFSIDNLDPLLSLKDTLLSLSLISPDLQADLSVLEKLPKLQFLAIWFLGQRDSLGFLAGLPLISLTLDDLEYVSDYSALRSLSQLTDLSLFGAEKLADWAILSAIPQLSSLSLSQSPLGIKVSEVVKQLPNLTSLQLRDYPQLDDCHDLPKLPLERLSLWGTQELEDITFASKCHMLRYLDLDHTAVSDLQPLSELEHLVSLDLRNCTNLENLTPLQSIEGLHTLFLYDAGPNLDLAPLAQNKNLVVHVRRYSDVTNGHLLGRRLKRLRPETTE